ncbi:MAG: hypothetical protein ACRDKI_12940 [Solirubrobacterales bacterium]
MRAPATAGAKVDHGQTRRPARKRPAEPEIKITRRSKRPEVKASRGSGKATTPQRRKVDRVAATRRDSLRSLNADRGPATRSRARSTAPRGGGGGSVRAVAVGAGAAAVGAVRVATEVARPAGAVAKPMLRVISGGLDRLPAAGTQPFAKGRILIMIAALLGAGLIYINVGKLQAGDGYSKYAARALVLQRENTALRAQVAHLDSAERIQSYAKRFGMVPPLPEQFTYLRSKHGDALKAAKGYAAPTTTNATPTAAPQQTATAAPQQASGTAPTNQVSVGGVTDATGVGGGQ